MDWPWADDVLYFEFTPLTVEFDPSLDAFTVARADIQATGSRRRLTLTVVASSREITIEHLTLEAAIAGGRSLLERLIGEHRGAVAELTTDTTYVFDLQGRRVR